jgi:radical SAM superfamily enzyme YgiQ (UPF0313 family)
MKKTKVLLLQLPVQSHDYEYSKENIPLALGYLKGFADRFLKRTDIEILPQEVVNLGGDEALLKRIEDASPDVVCFGCALWNIERTLYLCRELKARLPRTLLVLGGPEITTENPYLLTSGHFHVGVVGEGEETFRDLLLRIEQSGRDFKDIPGLFYKEGNRWASGSARPLIDPLDILPSPYLAGIIEPSFLNTMIIETVRGCPHRCTYCYYHKSYSRLRAFDPGRIESELRWAADRGVEEVYFIDPCFGRRPDHQNLLKLVRDINQGRKFSFQCELNAEDLSRELVDQLTLAGLEEVEIGLQTTNPTALEHIRRKLDQERFINGVRMLRDGGVRVRVDIMVGLPGDSLEDVKRTIDFVVGNDLYDDLSLYPLSVLPGTVLRRQAGELDIRYLEHPPYLVLETGDMAPEDIHEAFVYAEETAERDFFPVEAPLIDEVGEQGAAAGDVGFCSEIVLAGSGSVIPEEKIGRASCRERVSSPV